MDQGWSRLPPEPRDAADGRYPMLQGNRIGFHGAARSDMGQRPEDRGHKLNILSGLCHETHACQQGCGRTCVTRQRMESLRCPLWKA